VLPGQSKIDLVPEQPGGFNTVEQLAERLKYGGQRGAPEIAREERWQLAGGATAVRIDRKFAVLRAS
jgi:hypothetical protein